LKIGFGVERIRDNIFAVSDPGGMLSFNSLSDFLTNVPFFLSAAIRSAVTERGFRQTIVGATFRTIGPTEVQGKLTVLRHLTDATPTRTPCFGGRCD
jgi:hypothetical protein